MFTNSLTKLVIHYLGTTLDSFDVFKRYYNLWVLLNFLRIIANKFHIFVSRIALDISDIP